MLLVLKKLPMVDFGLDFQMNKKKLLA
uniref:CSON014324 protein n=1 Tax=Culicoides sonorensis TaxID=179676 RepID=A0A336NBC4_CULSO